MKNKIKQAGFKSIKEFAKYLKKPNQLVYRHVAGGDYLYNLLLDSFIKNNELQAKFESLELIFKANNG